MLDHLDITASSLATSAGFFELAIEPLGIAVLSRSMAGVGFGTNERPCLFIASAATKPTPVHIAFVARTRNQVDGFYRAALAAGGVDNGPPGLRTDYHANYYAAFVIAPDGHNVEAVCHEPEA